jgi:hypothetical protein
MNSQGTADQSRSSPLLSAEGRPQERLKPLLGLALGHAREAMHRDGALLPTLFVASPECLLIMASASWEGERQRRDFAAKARLMCSPQGITALVLAYISAANGLGRAWHLAPAVRDSEPPGSREFIVLSGQAAGGPCQRRLVRILRDGRGRFSGLGTILRPAAELDDGPLMHRPVDAAPALGGHGLGSSPIQIRGLSLMGVVLELRPHPDQSG